MEKCRLPSAGEWTTIHLNNSLLFIKFKNLRKETSGHMHIYAYIYKTLFSCSGCSREKDGRKNQKHSNTKHYTLVASRGEDWDNSEFRIQKSELSLQREEEWIIACGNMNYWVAIDSIWIIVFDDMNYSPAANVRVSWGCGEREDDRGTGLRSNFAWH